MKQNILLIIFLLFSFIANSKNNKVKRYYQYIQQAELKIIEGKLIEASNYYQKAFQLETVYFGYDIRNALRLEAELIPDSTRVYWCFRNYVKIGFDDYTKSFTSYKVFFELPYWASIQQMLDTIKTNFNHELTSELQLVYSLDQSIRLGSNNPGENPITVPKDEFKRIDSNNVVTMLRLLKEYKINQTTVKSEQLFSILLTVLFHNRGNDESHEKVNELFKAVKLEVLKGNFDAREYALAYDRRYSEVIKKEKPPREGYYGTESCFVTDEFFLTKIAESNKIKKEINKHRKQIYLDDYMLEAKKRLFQYKLAEDTFSLHYNFGLAYWAFPPNGIYKKKFFDWLVESNIKYTIYSKSSDININ